MATSHNFSPQSSEKKATEREKFHLSNSDGSLKVCLLQKPSGLLLLLFVIGNLLLRNSRDAT